jgi:hypothetical protein
MLYSFTLLPLVIGARWSSACVVASEAEVKDDHDNFAPVCRVADLFDVNAVPFVS